MKRLGYEKSNDVESLNSRVSMLPNEIAFAKTFTLNKKLNMEAIARMQYGVDTSIKSRLQQYFIENHKISLRIRLINVFIKLFSCVLYCVEVVMDKRDLPEHIKPPLRMEGELNFEYFWWVDRSDTLYYAQTLVALFSIAQTILVFYISYTGSIIKLLVNISFILELVTTLPFIVTLFIPWARQCFVPVFLNCWLAKGALQSMMNDLNRTFMNQSALFRQLLILFSMVVCLIFTGMCTIEHMQRVGGRPFDLFTSFYFVMVTLSTVGYGDYYPDNWISRLCVVILIWVTLIILPSQLEALGQTWSERQKSGGEYGTGFGRHEKHVVVTITHLEVEFITDFLDEFYAHPENQSIQVVLLSPAELDNQMRMLLKIPLWHSRVHYVRGSALRDEDLERAKVHTACAVFILSARHQNKKIITDEHTILRSWAMKDFAPSVRQYVQIFRPETKMHIEHAEVLICEDEFKYGLLANNCICPGISTFITLLMHTSRGEEGQKSTEPWHKVYGFHSGNEIYHIKVEDSKFFSDFVGKSFTYASFHAHKSYGIGLIGVKSSVTAKMRLNPGLAHIVQSTDVLYYMGLTNEESLFNFNKDLKNQRRKANVASTIANIGTVAIDVPHLEDGIERKPKPKRRGLLQKAKATDEVRLIDVPLMNSSRRPSIAMVTEAVRQHPFSSSESDSDEETSCKQCKGACIRQKVKLAPPPVRTYIGTSNTRCHTMKEKRQMCCLQLDKSCEHKPFTFAYQYNWTNRPIILAADKTSSGMYNLIIPLRAYYRPVHDLHPIILLLELDETDSPNPAFLDAISWFPHIYWIQGKISNLDNLLRAGVAHAEHVVVVKETAALSEEHFADCSTIITVQKIHRMFPRLRMITELTHASNMRFVQFNPNNPYSLAQSKFEKKEKKRGSHMPFMFRLPFAEGGVFSANMLDRLLYQAIVKPYVVELTRLMLGLDQIEGSGYLTSLEITEDDLWIKSYGRLYQKLCSSVADIPVGIFRTNKMDAKTVSLDMEEKCRSIDVTDSLNTYRQDMRDHVETRIRNIGMSADDSVLPSVNDYDRQDNISYVIINPSSDLQLETGDIIYVIRSPLKEEAAARDRSLINPRRGLRRSKNVTETMDSTTTGIPSISNKNPRIPQLIVS